MTRPLAQRSFLVTRPENQSARLAELLREAGATPLLAPMIVIGETSDAAALDAAIARIAEYDLVVFISPTALDQVAARRTGLWPAEVPVAVVGPASRERAMELGIADIVSPERRFDSEGLLEHPALQQMDGKRVLLFRGNGGRELLADSLAARGATVDIVEAYRRLPPQITREALVELLAQGCDGIIVTSSEAAHNLFELAGDALGADVRSQRFFVCHPAVAEALRHHGVERIDLADTGDAGLVAAIGTAFAEPVKPAAAERASVPPPSGPLAPVKVVDPFVPPVSDVAPAKPADAGWLPPHVRWSLGVGIVTVGAMLLLYRTGTHDLHGEIGQRLAGVENQLHGQSARNDRDATTISQLESRLAQSEQRFDELRAQQADLRALYSAVAGDQDEALLADAELTLSLASQQLQLTGNVGAALAALYRLDERLAGHEQARLEPLRRALARDIDGLKRVPFVDYVGLSARLDALAGGVDALPLVVDAKSPEDDGKPQAPAEHTGLWGDIGRALGALVSIRRIDQPDPILLAPQQALYLREHIKLRLLNARLALLQRDDATFRLDLADADKELRRHFDIRSKPVIATLATLRDVAATHPATALPSLADSLNAARDARRSVQKEDKR